MTQTPEELNRPATAVELQPDESAGGVAEPGHASPLSTALVAFGAVVMMLMIFRMLKRSTVARRSRAHHHETARETIDRHRSEALSAREPLTTMMAEADELARRLAKMLDNKATRLDALIAEANDRIAVLERLRGHPTASGPAGASSGSVEDRVLELAEDGCDSTQIAGRVGRTVGEVDLILALRRPRGDRTAG